MGFAPDGGAPAAVQDRLSGASSGCGRAQQGDSAMEGFADLVDTIALWLIGLLLFVALIGARELGGWLHKKIDGPTEGTAEDGTDKGFILSGVLGLLALLTAFTFSLSLNRYEVRRSTVVAEANAIGTAEMRVRLLAAPANAQLARMLQDYARTRLAYGE